MWHEERKEEENESYLNMKENQSINEEASE